MVDLPTESDPVRVIEGDCLSVLRDLPDGCVDAVIADPPYGTGGYRREASGQGSQFASGSRREAWDTWNMMWLVEAFRVSRGAVLTFCPDVELPGLLHSANQAGKAWRLLHWCKPDPMPHQGGQPAFGTETVVAFGPLQKVGARNWIESSSPRKSRDTEFAGHPYQKPLKVLRWLSKVACPADGLLLDPFAGSGTTGVAAALEGRRCILIEKEPTYAAICRERIAKVTSAGLFAEVM